MFYRWRDPFLNVKKNNLYSICSVYLPILYSRWLIFSVWYFSNIFILLYGINKRLKWHDNNNCKCHPQVRKTRRENVLLITRGVRKTNLGNIRSSMLALWLAAVKYDRALGVPPIVPSQPLSFSRKQRKWQKEMIHRSGLSPLGSKHPWSSFFMLSSLLQDFNALPTNSYVQKSNFMFPLWHSWNYRI